MHVIQFTSYYYSLFINFSILFNDVGRKWFKFWFKSYFLTIWNHTLTLTAKKYIKTLTDNTFRFRQLYFDYDAQPQYIGSKISCARTSASLIRLCQEDYKTIWMLTSHEHLQKCLNTHFNNFYTNMYNKIMGSF